MDRRDLLKTMALAAAAPAAVGAVAGASATQAQAQAPAGNPIAAMPGHHDVTPVNPDYFISDRFAGKTYIVTGSARGMGKVAAERLAREGANVVGVDWIADEGAAVIAAIKAAGGKAEFVPGDVSDTAVCDRMVEVAVSTFGGLDGAINNAGVMDAIPPSEPIDYDKQKDLAFNPVHLASDAYWDVVMRVNATGVFRCMRAQLRHMVEQGKGGSIVNVASVAGLRGFSSTPSYVASKHAVNGLTKNASIDYAPYGIRINSVNMANTDTPMVQRAKQLVGARMKALGGVGMGTIKTRSLLQYADTNYRDATPEEQVAIMLFLLSDEASNITGANWATDGGFTTY